MNKLTIKKLFLTCGIFLLITLPVADAWEGPCESVGNCGGTGPGMGTCKPGPLEEGGICQGQCQDYCPSGVAESACQGQSGDCQSHSFTCSEGKGYNCLNKQFGIGCECVFWRTTICTGHSCS